MKLFHQTLCGTTCYVSRIKNHGYNIGWQPFCTLHSVVYKILRRSSIGRNDDALHNMLIGEATKLFVELAYTELFHVAPTEEQLEQYYKALRSHFSGLHDLQALPKGKELLTVYTRLKDEGLDWDESMRLATWYLQHEHVHQIKDFTHDNIILLNYDQLQKPHNRTGYTFFKAFAAWNKRVGAYNLYIVENEQLVCVGRKRMQHQAG